MDCLISFRINELNLALLGPAVQRQHRFAHQIAHVDYLPLRGGWPCKLHELAKDLVNALRLIDDGLERALPGGICLVAEEVLRLPGNDR